MRTAQGPFPMETTYTWQPAAGDQTKMTLRNRGKPSGFAMLAAPDDGVVHAPRQQEGPGAAQGDLEAES